MEILFNSDYGTMWEAFGTITNGVASIMAIAALIYSMTTYKESLQVSHYSELDSTYFELLKSVLDKPHLHTSNVIRSGDQIIEYDVYAFMVWNFLEAIYDRCKDDKHLCDTWYPVIDEENRKHGQWFNHPDNYHKFKVEFHLFINDEKFLLDT